MNAWFVCVKWHVCMFCMCDTRKEACLTWMTYIHVKNASVMCVPWLIYEIHKHTYISTHIMKSCVCLCMQCLICVCQMAYRFLMCDTRKWSIVHVNDLHSREWLTFTWMTYIHVNDLHSREQCLICVCYTPSMRVTRHIYEMPHLCVSHVTYIYFSCVTPVNEAFSTWMKVMAHMWI